MIPEALEPVVDRALAAAFGTTAYDSVSLVAGGMRSALACRVVVRGSAYFVRVGASTLVDPAVDIANTRAAADAGIAPRLHHADAADRVMVSDFIERAPLPPGFDRLVAQTIVRIHALPPWPKTIHHLATLDRFLARLQRTDLDDVRAAYARLAAVYPRDADLVACHNDLKPHNLLFDGERLWVVDWEAAFGNDRFADLANVASFFVTDEDAYLAAYFGRPATAYERARFELARWANHLAYVAFLSLFAAQSSQPTPDFRAFHAGLVTGAIDLADDAIKMQYANAHLAEARNALQGARFSEAIAVVQRGP